MRFTPIFNYYDILGWILWTRLYQIARFFILGWVTTSWTYSMSKKYCPFLNSKLLYKKNMEWILWHPMSIASIHMKMDKTFWTYSILLKFWNKKILTFLLLPICYEYIVCSENPWIRLIAVPRQTHFIYFFTP